ncbi:uncharacterized protein PG986_010728 [Apiospora aurea]|uniref:Heterokaryon incompatibility domain-containing protein n=1 Tax=Apiospora aurea TaxID=335848 RepID=A0ABR1Q376_9PEZI
MAGTGGFSFDPRSIEYSHIGSLIARCDREHQSCGIRANRPAKSLRHFRLIHCASGKVVRKARTCDYVALSYVWGQVPLGTMFRLGSRPKYPATIEDAIQVTMRLGFAYLWVDRYCIDQASSAHQTEQIQQMGQIYEQAALTILAAAGTDPSYGLPGVSRPRIGPTDRVDIGGLTIAHIPDSPEEYVENSVWATRGWTYQEACLSRRRLFFTDSQLYYECHAGNCEELSFYRGPQATHPAYKPFASVFEADPSTILRCILEYSSREVGFLHDRLRAFLGILATFSEASEPIFHLWGVPFMLRHGKYELGLGLLESTSSIRSPEFPSWSWLGWSGHATQKPLVEGLSQYRSTYSIMVEEGDQVLDLTPQLLQRYYSVEGTPEAAPAALQLEGMAFPIYVIKDFELRPGCRLILADRGRRITNWSSVLQLVRNSDWVCWQQPNGKWIYETYQVVNRSFLGSQEGNEIKLLGFPLLEGSTKWPRTQKEIAILREVEGGHETVGYLSILGPYFTLDVQADRRAVDRVGGVIEVEEGYELPQMEHTKIRWL